MSEKSAPFQFSRRTFGGMALAACAMPSFAQAQDGARPTLVELFTSQGCNACPAADALMLKLAADPTMIPLTFATEIWDYLGWKDTLARPAFTRRHKAYAAGLANRRVYTPQAVVNGRAHCVGSDLTTLTRLKRTAVSSTDSATIALSRSGTDWDARITRSGSNPARLVLLPVSARRSVEIERGENMGKTITYANVVRDIIDLGPASSGTSRIEARRLAGLDADAFALLVQAGTLEAPGEVFGSTFSGNAEG
ncbi:MAG: DUF1223 domain-containing protein [Rhizobiales bacterium]|nr:DUF1223 domain-containing protein [Hyphomicrobiales bacterium]